MLENSTSSVNNINIDLDIDIDDSGHYQYRYRIDLKIRLSLSPGTVSKIGWSHSKLLYVVLSKAYSSDEPMNFLTEVFCPIF